MASDRETFAGNPAETRTSRLSPRPTLANTMASCARFAVVTGANRGIGLVVANALADQGFCIIAVSRRAADAEEAVRRLPKKDASHVHVPLGIDLTSLTNDANARRAAQSIENIAAGNLELLVNNAGIYLDRWDQKAGTKASL